VLQIRPGQQILHEVERRRVEPLQIVEKQRQRMFRSGEHGDEPAEHQLETALRLLRLELRDRRLFSDDELQLGDEVGHEPCIRLERLQKRAAPDRQLGVALAEKGAHKALKGLHQGRIGDVAIILVELAGCQEPPRRHKNLMQFVDDGRFADAGIA